MADSWEEYMRKYIENADVPDDFKDEALMGLASHIPKGRVLFNSRKFREAIAEWANDCNRPIKSNADADLVQTAYCFIGEAYKELGEWDNAITALQKARDLLKQYRTGIGTESILAEVFIAQGRLDEAIVLCEEALKRQSNWNLEQHLAKALELKRLDEQSKSD